MKMKKSPAYLARLERAKGKRYERKMAKIEGFLARKENAEIEKAEKAEIERQEKERREELRSSLSQEEIELLKWQGRW